MGSFSILTLAFAMILIAGHGAIVNYFLIVFQGLAFAAFGAVDVALCLYLLLGKRMAYAAVAGSLTWMIHTWVYVVRLAVLFFVVPASKITHLENHPLEGKVPLQVLFLCLYLLPIIYGTLAARAAAGMTGPRLEISILYMLYSDIIVHVMIDMIDLTFASLQLLRDSDRSGLPIGNAVAIGVAIFLHSYSFPTSIGSSQRNRDQGDIFLTRKHAALVGMVFVDIPLLTFRIIDYARMFKTVPTLNPFIWKNLLFIPIQAYRLNQCRLAEKLPHTRRFEGDDLADAKILSSEIDGFEGSGRIKKQGFKSTVVATNHKFGGGQSVSFAHLRKRNMTSSGERIRFGSEDNLGEPDDTVLSPDMEEEEAAFRIEQEEADNQIQMVFGAEREKRSLPLRGFKSLTVLAKVWHALRVGGTQGLAGILDDGFILGYWKQLRFILPLITHFTAQLAVVLYASQLPLTPASQDYFWKNIAHPSKEIILTLSVSFGGAIILFLCYVATAPFLDVLFVTVFWIVRIMSTYVAFTVLRRSTVLSGKHWGMDPKYEWVFPMIAFCVRPTWHLIKGLLTVQSAALGRQLMYFYVPAATSEVQESIRAEGDELDTTRVRGDEVGCVSTSVALMFVLCRNKIAPVAFNELLIGPDVVKSIRLCDQMLVTAWHQLLVTIGVRLFLVMQCIDWLSVIFIAHAVLNLLYIILAQTNRLLVLRKHEVNQLFEDVVRGTVGEKRDLSAYLMRRLKYKTMRLATSSLKNSFFTSPGNLWPPFL